MGNLEKSRTICLRELSVTFANVEPNTIAGARKMISS
jgi:hypothetical protein